MAVTWLYPYTLTLQAPALLAGLEGDASGARSLPYIPGGAIRGAVARSLTATGRDAELDDLVLGDTVRYLHAYPEASGGGRSRARSRCG